MRIHTVKEFAEIFARERCRADRKDVYLTLIDFELQRSALYEPVKETLEHVLCKRVRTYDEIGWLDAYHIGVLLPDTPVDGARALVSDIVKTVFPKFYVPRHAVFSYPTRGVRQARSAAAHPSPPSPADEREVPERDVISRLKPVLPKRMPVWKRLMDILVALTALVLLSPVLLLIALFIKMGAPGPLFFKQERMGYLGRAFTCWKFRTMQVDADSAPHRRHMQAVVRSAQPLHKLDDHDPRIIRGGKFLRKTGLDELPQLINVLRGEMSLSGPRPCIPYEAGSYRLWQCRRFETLPGLTGLTATRPNQAISLSPQPGPLALLPVARSPSRSYHYGRWWALTPPFQPLPTSRVSPGSPAGLLSVAVVVTRPLLI